MLSALVLLPGNKWFKMTNKSVWPFSMELLPVVAIYCRWEEVILSTIFSQLMLSCVLLSCTNQWNF